MSDINNSSRQIKLPLIIAIAVSVGLIIGTLVVNPKQQIASESSKAITKFREVVTNIDRNYVDSINSSALVDQAIITMLEELDPHTVYVSSEQLELSNMRLKGGYDGIGVQFDIIRDTIVVIKPNANGPAERAGLKVGDRIVKVEDELLAGVNLQNKDVTDRLLGKEGTDVNISIIRYGEKELREFNIVRGKIPQRTVVSSYMATEDIGYIKLMSFGINSYSEFKTALVDLKKQGMKKLILDLQGNGGGYMGAAEKIADELIDGDAVIVSQKGKIDRYTSTVRAKRQGEFETQPVIVLMDEYSASASEIVAGALQDNDRALIVGRRSFGKGLVQMPINLNDGSELRLTIARYYTPSGRSIQKPYENGSDAGYAHDIVDRYSNGEFFYQDSIKFDDSLKYTTPKGRVVYGGGGIMPDNFVPYDSALSTDYFNEMLANRAIREYTLKYYLDNRATLENYTMADYITNFRITEAEMTNLIHLCSELGIEYNKVQLTYSSTNIKSFVKAEIARAVWDDNGFYPIYNATLNKPFEKALTLFDDAQALVDH